jgi:hypothetical protein
MARVTISSGRDHFLRGGKKFFYLADTAWSVFTNVPAADWEEYLDLRSSQGFNALQINILPQWDRTQVQFSPQPFKTGRGGAWDFTRPEPEYFQQAASMLEPLHDRGMVPALVVLWCDFVKGTWACAKMPDHEMPLDAIAPFIGMACKTFEQFEPVYLVSGDTDFKSPDTAERYLLALREVRKASSGSLTTLHLNPLADLPPQVVDSRELDFYMFQSGHDAEQRLPIALSRKFYGLPVKRPVVNGEVCYEGHGFGNTYGRFGAWHVRRAIWQSLLSGAKAGVCYGAHGVWSWHRRGLDFPGKPFSSTPYTGAFAARLPGAWDAGYARWAFETFDLFGIEPVEAAHDGSEEIRVSATPDRKKIAVYMPHAAEVTFNLEMEAGSAFLVNLSDRSIVKPVLKAVTGGRTALSLPEVNSDCLLVVQGQ